VATQQELATWHAHAGGCLKVRFAPDGQSIASSGVDGTVRLWKLPPPRAEPEIRPLPSGIRDVMLFAEPPTVAMTLTGFVWQLWPWPELSPRHRGVHSTNGYSSLKAIPSGRLLEYEGPDVRVQHVSDGRIEPLVRSDLGNVLSTDLSRNGQRLVFSAVNGLAVWQLDPRIELRRWPTPGEGWSRHVRLSPNDTTVVTLHEHDGTVTFRDIASGTTTSVSGQSIGDSVLSFSRDGRWLATAGLGAGVQLYDVARRQLIASLDHTSGTVTALAFSRDAERLACGLSRGAITLWDLTTRREVGVLTGPKSLIYSLAFMADETLVAATRDEIRVWRAPKPTDGAAESKETL
jgi:WD40 repeat protein